MNITYGKPYDNRLHNIIINVYLSVSVHTLSLHSLHLSRSCSHDFLILSFRLAFHFSGSLAFFRSCSLSLSRSVCVCFWSNFWPIFAEYFAPRSSTKQIQIQIQTHKRMINELLFSLRSHFILLTLYTDAKVLVSYLRRRRRCLCLACLLARSHARSFHRNCCYIGVSVYAE